MPHYQPNLVGILKRVNDGYLSTIAAAEMTRQNAIASAQSTYASGVRAGSAADNASLAAALAAADQVRADAGRNATVLRDRLSELVRKAPDLLSGNQSSGAESCNWATAAEAVSAIQATIPDLAPYVQSADVIQVS